MTEQASPYASEHADQPHAVPLRVLAMVFGLLLMFTFLTVAATWVDLGDLNIWIALGIALIKVILVCLYFMHLRYDSPFYSLVLGSAFLFVVLFIGIALMDSEQYEPAVRAASPPAASTPAP